MIIQRSTFPSVSMYLLPGNLIRRGTRIVQLRVDIVTTLFSSIENNLLYSRFFVEQIYFISFYSLKFIHPIEIVSQSFTRQTFADIAVKSRWNREFYIYIYIYIYIKFYIIYIGRRTSSPTYLALSLLSVSICSPISATASLCFLRKLARVDSC